MSTFVLVPGAWLGGWTWKRVSPILEEKGHKVYHVTLTGTGERVHVVWGNLGIETAIQDIANAINYNDLSDLILVGLSFSVKVCAPVADRVSDRVRMFLDLDGYIPEKIRTPQGRFPDEFPIEGSAVPLRENFLEVVGKDVQGANQEWLISKEMLDGPYRIIDSGHWPMITKPKELVEAMLT